MNTRNVVNCALIAIGLLLIYSNFHPAGAQDKRTRINTEAEDKKRLILDEVEKIDDHPWAGSYSSYLGLGYAYSLTLAPQSGFVAEWLSCTARNAEYGKVIFSNGIIKLIFQNKNKTSHIVDEEFVLVQWGNRRYLIPSKEMIDFCNSINSGRESCQLCESRFLLRNNDEQGIPEGTPQLPERYQGYILKSPIQTSIISVNKSYLKKGRFDGAYRVVEVTLDKGASAGIKVGMELYVSSPEPCNLANIVEVRNDISIAKFVAFDGENIRPQAGWKLSTRLNPKFQFLIGMKKTLLRSTLK